MPSTLGWYALSSNETVNGAAKYVDSESSNNIWGSSNISPAKARKKSNQHGFKSTAVRPNGNGTSSGSSNKKTLVVQGNSSSESF